MNSDRDIRGDTGAFVDFRAKNVLKRRASKQVESIKEDEKE